MRVASPLLSACWRADSDRQKVDSFKGLCGYLLVMGLPIKSLGPNCGSASDSPNLTAHRGDTQNVSSVLLGQFLSNHSRACSLAGLFPVGRTESGSVYVSERRMRSRSEPHSSMGPGRGMAELCPDFSLARLHRMSTGGSRAPAALPSYPSMVFWVCCTVSRRT